MHLKMKTTSENLKEIFKKNNISYYVKGTRFLNDFFKEIYTLMEERSREAYEAGLKENER